MYFSSISSIFMDFLAHKNLNSRGPVRVKLKKLQGASLPAPLGVWKVT